MNPLSLNKWLSCLLPWSWAVCYFDTGGDAPEPDPAIGQAAAQQAALSKESLDWYKQIYASDIAPRQARQDALTEQVASAAMADSAAQRARSNDQYAFWNDNYRPLEVQSAKEAADAGGESDQNRAAGRAVSDVRQQQVISRGISDRNLTSMGVNPNSTRFVAADKANDLKTTAMAAGGATNAREIARDKGITLRTGAVSTGRGMQNLAAQTINQGSSFGTGAASVTNANVGSGINSAGVMGNGYTTSGNLNASAGSMLNTAYGNKLAAYNADDNSGLYSALGSVAGAYVGSESGSKAITSIFSDEKVKKNIKPVSEVAALNGITKLNVKSWKYDPDKIDDQDGDEHIGAMAQDMQKHLGRKVSNGHMVDLISAVGVNMAAIKALNKKVDQLKGEKA